MSDIRALLKNERASRRIQHKHATYSATGSLLCTVCHLQLKSESLWDGHLTSSGHILRLQNLRDTEAAELSAAADPPVENNSKKRKAVDEEGPLRKRGKPENGFPEGFFDAISETAESRTVLPSPTTELQIPSRPATPLKPAQETIKRPEVDEDEWAAFEAEIAAAEMPKLNENAIISAPAMTAAQLAQKSTEESNRQKKERQEADLEGDKEDAARKMEDELDEMQELEQRVKKLRERREALRKENALRLKQEAITLPVNSGVDKDQHLDEEDEDQGDDYDDDWDSFRMR